MVNGNLRCPGSVLHYPPTLRSHPVPSYLPHIHTRRQLRQRQISVKIPKPSRLYLAA